MPLPERDSPGRTLMRHEAYRELRRLIVNGTLQPAERLRDHDVARWLGVSRTPVREALTRLADEGLVEMAPNRYTRVRPLSAVDAEHGYPIAASLSGLAAEIAASNASPRELGRLRVEAERYTWALLREDADELIGADDAFHDRLAEISGNHQLAAQLDRLVPRLRQLEAGLGERIAAIRPDLHDGVIAALTESDGRQARRLVEEEWRAVGARVESELRPAGSGAG